LVCNGGSKPTNRKGYEETKPLQRKLPRHKTNDKIKEEFLLTRKRNENRDEGGELKVDLEGVVSTT